MKRIVLGLVLIVPKLFLPLWMTAPGEIGIPDVPPRGRVDAADLSDLKRSIQGTGFVKPVAEPRKLVFKVVGVITRSGIRSG
jgi:hypothetical protein